MTGKKKSNSRIPVQVSEKFHEKLKELEMQFMMNNGKKRSLRELTEDIISDPNFKEIEKRIIKANKNIDINIKFDRRIL